MTVHTKRNDDTGKVEEITFSLKKLHLIVVSLVALLTIVGFIWTSARTIGDLLYVNKAEYVKDMNSLHATLAEMNAKLGKLVAVNEILAKQHGM